MDIGNQTTDGEFILMGLTNLPKLKALLFMLFAAIYFMTLVGNISIIVLTRTDPRLQSAMYLFLGNLSFIDIGFSSSVTPNMLASLLSGKNNISFFGCAVQMFTTVAFGTAECLLFAAMAYDRYVAICNPFLYAVIVSKKLCLQLVTSSYLGGFLHGAIHAVATFQLPFCGSNKIYHFFCDIPPLLKLSCSDTRVNEILLFIFPAILGVGSLLIVLASYIYIISAILKIQSTEGRRKAFSTCASHFTAVSLLFGSTIFTYVKPTSMYSQDQGKVLSLIYSVLIPMLNPLIYSVRNNEVKAAAKKLLIRRQFSHGTIFSKIILHPDFCRVQRNN
ncbi:olfactory receptor 1086-like [Rhinatrema bivittatum]|uniref:olfactory receptor 1086-like n=1 Tax=Rhinatrema bivittatum TaxID=194408 RepID=UPI00112E6A3A|nr:olfactory receptor 1086-like [Rhinatrema bivittatum]